MQQLLRNQQPKHQPEWKIRIRNTLRECDRQVGLMILDRADTALGDLAYSDNRKITRDALRIISEDLSMALDMLKD